MKPMKKTSALLLVAALTGIPATSQDIVTEEMTTRIYDTFSTSLNGEAPAL